MASKFRAALLAVAVLGVWARTDAQGCSQCRDTVSQTNPGQQQSYREAIGILLTGAMTVAGASVIVIRRFGR